MDLAPVAKAAAEHLLEKHPDVVFTSGRHAVRDQARAMASNVILNRQWIKQTYVWTSAIAGLQGWVDSHPQATGVHDIETGLESVMLGWSKTRLATISLHLTGMAFDVQPMPDGPDAKAVKATIRKLPHLHKFLEREGGLVRWHAQFV